MIFKCVLQYLKRYFEAPLDFWNWISREYFYRLTEHVCQISFLHVQRPLLRHLRGFFQGQSNLQLGLWEVSKYEKCLNIIFLLMFIF